MDKTVRFSDEVTIIIIPYEDRKGDWMTMSLDRCRFKRRIDHTAKIINPVLLKHLETVSSKFIRVQMKKNNSYTCSKE